MKILLIGSGGREHAIADALVRENAAVQLVAAPGNPGIEAIARTVAVNSTDAVAVAHLAEAEAVDLVVVGPEAPLAAGVVDVLTQRGIAAFGPTSDAASIETPKAATKAMMLHAGIPTANAETHRLAVQAKAAVHERFGAPVVIKASGLAAGKGVIVCQTKREAEAAIDRVLVDQAFGEAGAECLVEEFMEGEELSLFAIADGTDVLPMIGAQDHKRLLEGDEGPNTGGMGAYAPVSIATPELVDDITERILLPTLHAMRKRDMPFRGLLYAGLMLTATGPRVVEFNCRFGDPETQAILPLLESSLLEPMLTVARGGRIGSFPSLQWKPAHAVTTVVAAQGYPEKPRTGDAIRLPDDADDVRVYHAGTSKRDGALVTSGGRVVAVTGIGDTFEAARQKSRTVAARVEFEGAQFRGDIGWREAARHAGTT